MAVDFIRLNDPVANLGQLNRFIQQVTDTLNQQTVTRPKAAQVANLVQSTGGTRGNSTSGPYDVVFSLAGVPTASFTFPWIEFVRIVSFPANFAGSWAGAGTMPTAAATYSIYRKLAVDFAAPGFGASVGTIKIAPDGIAAFTTSGGLTLDFGVGDLMSIRTPNPQDATLADVAITLAGTRI